MTVFFVILAVLLSLLALLLALMWLPVRFRVSCRISTGGADYIAEFKLPFLPVYLRARPRGGRRPEDRPAEGPEEATTSLRGLGDFARVAKEALSRFEAVYPGLRRAVSIGFESITVTELTLRCRAGTGDAGEAALIAGTLRAALGILLSYARRKGMRFESRPCISITPVFSEKAFEGDLRLAASVVPWKATLAALILYRVYRRDRPRRVVSKATGWNTRA